MIGKRLKALRIGKGLEQKNLASILNTTPQAISNYERDKRNPDLKTLNAIADFFDVSIDYLTGRTDIQKPKYLSDQINVNLEESVKEEAEDILVYLNDKALKNKKSNKTQK